jgi:hypothetical protein
MQTVTSATHTPSRYTGRVLVAIFVVALLGALGALVSPATAGPDTMRAKGTLLTHLVTGAECASPSGLCFSGEVHGALTGTLDSLISSLTPTPQPGVQLVDAVVTIKTNRGDLTFAHELVLFNTEPEAKGEFAWQMQITSGTGRYAGATGYLQGVGNAPLSTGVSEGGYVGEITLA